MKKHSIKSSSLAKEYLIISQKIIGELIDEIENRKSNENEIVHTLRKGVKELRAILKLLRKSFGADFYKTHNFLLRDLNRKSAAIRNQYALINLVKLNIVSSENEKIKEALELLSDRLVTDFNIIEKSTDYSALFSQYKSQLNKYQNHLSELPDNGSGFASIKKSLLNIYSEGQALSNLCFHTPTQKNLHKWRRVAKDFYYVSQTLIPIWKSFINAYVKESMKLSDYLGDINDYFELKNYIQSLIDNPFDFSILFDLIENNQKKLIEASYQIGSRIYSIEPNILIGEFKMLYLIYKKELKL